MKKACFMFTIFLLLSFVGCSPETNLPEGSSIYQSNSESKNETENQLLIDVSPKTTEVKKTEVPSETVVQVNEKYNDVSSQKETSGQTNEIFSSTTINVHNKENSKKASNIQLEYTNYHKTENGLSLVVKVPKEVGVGQKFVAYATVKNVSDKTIYYALPSSSELKPKIDLSITSAGKSFTNIDTYRKMFTDDMVYTQLEPNQEIDVVYNICPGKVNGSTSDGLSWQYFEAGTYSGIATFNFGGKNSKLGNTQKISVEFTINVV